MDKTYVQYLKYCSLSSHPKILPCGYLIKKYIYIPCKNIKKKMHSKILRMKPNKQHLSIVSKSYLFHFIIKNIKTTINYTIKNYKLM